MCSGFANQFSHFLSLKKKNTKGNCVNFKALIGFTQRFMNGVEAHPAVRKELQGGIQRIRPSQGEWAGTGGHAQQKSSVVIAKLLPFRGGGGPPGQ